MGALSEYERTTLEGLFHMADFRSMFNILNQEYEGLKFKDPLSDNERIKEYQYITQQLRKYMSGKQEPILACGGNLDAMLKQVEAWLGNAAEYGTERKELVYNFVRDSWLLELYNGISYLIDLRTQDQEEDE